jgi:hypothetical protein
VSQNTANQTKSNQIKPNQAKNRFEAAHLSGSSRQDGVTGGGQIGVNPVESNLIQPNKGVEASWSAPAERSETPGYCRASRWDGVAGEVQLDQSGTCYNPFRVDEWMGREPRVARLRCASARNPGLDDGTPLGFRGIASLPLSPFAETHRQDACATTRASIAPLALCALALNLAFQRAGSETGAPNKTLFPPRVRIGR